MVSLQVHTFYCQLRHWNCCPVLCGDTYPVDDAVSDISVPAFHSGTQKGKTNEPMAKCKLFPPVPMAVPACCQQYKPQKHLEPCPGLLSSWAAALGRLLSQPFLQGKSSRSPKWWGVERTAAAFDCHAVLAGLCPGSLLALPTGITGGTLPLVPH